MPQSYERPLLDAQASQEERWQWSSSPTTSTGAFTWYAMPPARACIYAQRTVLLTCGSSECCYKQQSKSSTRTHSLGRPAASIPQEYPTHLTW